MPVLTSNGRWAEISPRIAAIKGGTDGVPKKLEGGTVAARAGTAAATHVEQRTLGRTQQNVRLHRVRQRAPTSTAVCSPEKAVVLRESIQVPPSPMRTRSTSALILLRTEEDEREEHRVVVGRLRMSSDEVAATRSLIVTNLPVHEDDSYALPQEHALRIEFAQFGDVVSLTIAKDGAPHSPGRAHLLKQAGCPHRVFVLGGLCRSTARSERDLQGLGGRHFRDRGVCKRRRRLLFRMPVPLPVSPPPVPSSRAFPLVPRT